MTKKQHRRPRGLPVARHHNYVHLRTTPFVLLRFGPITSALVALLSFVVAMYALLLVAAWYSVIAIVTGTATIAKWVGKQEATQEWVEYVKAEFRHWQAERRSKHSEGR